MIVYVGFLSYSFFNSARKVAFIDTQEVFNGFKMSKEVDGEVRKIEEHKKQIMDSLADQLKKIQAGIIKVDEKQLEYLKRDFLQKRNQFSEDVIRLKQASIEKVWKQINQYTSDYGKENNLDMILGANGQGSLMYAKEKINISKEIINYINEKYSGDK